MGLGKRIITSDASGFVATEHFAPLAYTGNGGTQALNVGFQPDWVWIKPRETSRDHSAYDSLRGTSKIIAPNGTAIQQDLSSNGVTVFGSNGFTVVDNSDGDKNVNGAAGGGNSGTNGTYASWVWKAGGSPTATNSGGSSPTSGSVMIDGAASTATLAGSISANKLSANTAAGFSIVQFTGNGGTGTVAHGLTAAPDMIIAKSTTVAQNWVVYHKDIANPSENYMQWNSDLAPINEAVWGNTQPTSSVFSIGNPVIINTSSSTSIAYCFHSVSGYQKFGKYTGNNSTTNRIYTTDDGSSSGSNGFQPRFLMLKKITSGDPKAGWNILDSARSTSNPRNHRLLVNSNGAENQNTAFNVNFNSDGFTIATTDVDWNANSVEYIYWTIA